MSVALSIINDPDGDSVLNVSNASWADIAKAGGAGWNGYHDLRVYTPDELRAIADAKWPADYDQVSDNWRAALRYLADRGGAELS